LPQLLSLEFRVAEQDWFDARTVKLLSYRQELDLRRGMLLRSISFEDTRDGAVRSRAAPDVDERHASRRTGTGADR